MKKAGDQKKTARRALPALVASLVFHGALLGFCAAAVREAVPRPAEFEVNVVAVDPPVPRQLDELVALVEAAAPSAEPYDAPAVVEAVPPPDINIPDAPAALVVSSAEAVVEIGPAEATPAPDPRPLVIAPTTPRTDAGGSGYWLGVRGQIVRHLNYPRVKRGFQVDTNILLRITLDARGGLVAALVANAEPSPFTLAAQRAVERAAPFDVPGAEVPLTMELPVRFERFE